MLALSARHPQEISLAFLASHGHHHLLLRLPRYAIWFDLRAILGAITAQGDLNLLHFFYKKYGPASHFFHDVPTTEEMWSAAIRFGHVQLLDFLFEKNADGFGGCHVMDPKTLIQQCWHSTHRPVLEWAESKRSELCLAFLPLPYAALDALCLATDLDSLNWAWALHVKHQVEMLKDPRFALIAASKNGTTALLEWIWDHAPTAAACVHQTLTHALAAASEHGNIAALEWWLDIHRRYGGEINVAICLEHASRHGRCDVLAWWLAHSSMQTAAPWWLPMRIAQFLPSSSSAPPFDYGPTVVTAAATSGSLDALEWWWRIHTDHGLLWKCDIHAFLGATTNGDTKVLDWLWSKYSQAWRSITFEFTLLMKVAARFGHLGAIRWWLKHAGKANSHKTAWVVPTINAATINAHIDVLEFLLTEVVKKGTGQWTSSNYYYTSLVQGNLAVAQWHDAQPDFRNAPLGDHIICAVSNKGHGHVLEWLYEHHDGEYDRANFFKIVPWGLNSSPNARVLAFWERLIAEHDLTVEPQSIALKFAAKNGVLGLLEYLRLRQQVCGKKLELTANDVGDAINAGYFSTVEWWHDASRAQGLPFGNPRDLEVVASNHPPFRTWCRKHGIDLLC
ncbi:hypothetical protein BC828DRAFT_422928 [Blastocladiella britannica]|nr:hypothetical protein BC828DRAFT_422928 [Blastocladiella britannica]